MRNSAWRPQLASTPPGIRLSASTSHSSTASSTLKACRIARCGTTKIDAMVCSVMSITNANRAAAALLSRSLTTGACHSWVTIVLDGTQPESITRFRMLKWALMNSIYRSSRKKRRRKERSRRRKERSRRSPNLAIRKESKTCATSRFVRTTATVEAVAARKS